MDYQLTLRADHTLGVASADRAQDGTPAALPLMSLYVRAAHHGTGLADRLLTAAVGAEPAFLWVFAANPRTRRSYARHGFVPDGTEMTDADTGRSEIRMVRT